MIRFISTASLLALLILVLYLPSAHPPQEFIDRLRIEHQLNIAFWGQDHATRILARMLDIQATSSQASPVPSMTDAREMKSAGNEVANEMAKVNQRLFNNQYFHSIDSLLALATYRFSALIEWMPILLVFMLAVLLDGFLLRIIKGISPAQPGSICPARLRGDHDCLRDRAGVRHADDTRSNAHSRRAGRHQHVHQPGGGEFSSAWLDDHGFEVAHEMKAASSGPATPAISPPPITTC